MREVNVYIKICTFCCYLNIGASVSFSLNWKHWNDSNLWTSCIYSLKTGLKKNSSNFIKSKNTFMWKIPNFKNFNAYIHILFLSSCKHHQLLLSIRKTTIFKRINICMNNIHILTYKFLPYGNPYLSFYDVVIG